MIEIYILIAKMFVGGFATMPQVNLEACETAMNGLPLAIVQSAECYPIEMIAHSGSRYAPEMAPRPVPKPKPGRSA